MSYPGQKYRQNNPGYPGSTSQPSYPPYPPPQGGYVSPPPGPGGFAPPLGPPPQGIYPPPTGPPPSQDAYVPPSYPPAQGGYAPPSYPPAQGGYAPPPYPPTQGSYAPPPYPPTQGSYIPPSYPPTQGSYPPPINPPPNERPLQQYQPPPINPPPNERPLQQYQPPPVPPPTQPPPNSFPQYPSSGYTPPPGIHLYQNANARPASHVQLSNCTGRKRALLIGINYVNTRFELKGCINDVDNMKKFLIDLYGFREADMVILTDNQKDPKNIPTRENILNGMRWLVHDPRPNDSFFFHFSGHGGQEKDLDGDEDDGYDETIMPLDFQKNGQIIDDTMHDIMVKPLPPGVRLTAIFDSCHSGTALDLPYIYSTQGKVKEPNILSEGGNAIMSAGMSYLRGDFNGIKTSLMSLGKKVTSGKNISAQTKQTKSSSADVIMLSGCKDAQTSADTNEAGLNTGAMSYALITTLRKDKNITYQQLLVLVRDILAAKYSQKPQLSASHEMNMGLPFII